MVQSYCESWSHLYPSTVTLPIPIDNCFYQFLIYPFYCFSFLIYIIFYFLFYTNS